jgi:hypothetical protein
VQERQFGLARQSGAGADGPKIALLFEKLAPSRQSCATLDSMALTLSVRRPVRWLLTTTIALLALGASATSLPNIFVQDDIAVVRNNDENHSLSKPWIAFTRPYWPKPFSPDLYRPLQSLALATQWVAGDGRPALFRITSILLYAASAVAFFWLAGMLLPIEAAWSAAALFAVHPVHVEAIAVAVNQGEMIVGLVATLWVGLYVIARRRGALSTRASVAYVLTYVLACFFKENAVILPGLLIAAEFTLVSDPRSFRVRVAAIRPLILALIATGLAFLTVRSLVLNNVVGTFTSEALQGLSVGQRGVTMIGIVPEWVRLLSWPAHLQADYSPQEIGGATTWGFAQTLGLILLAGAVGGAIAARRTAPAMTFGLLWTGIALFPVSNVLVPTGVVLAERTLYLASMGFLLSAGALMAMVFNGLHENRPVIRRSVLGALMLLIATGMIASARRHRTWATPHTHALTLLVDAPLSYRAHHGIAGLLWADRQYEASEREYRRALQLYPGGFTVARDLADHLRLQARCGDAIPLYQQALHNAPSLTEIRSSYIACLMYEGRYAVARSEARIGLAVDGGGTDSLNLRNFRAAADRAIIEKAPPGTVRLTVQPNARDSVTHGVQ